MPPCLSGSSEAGFLAQEVFSTTPPNLGRWKCALLPLELLLGAQGRYHGLIDLTPVQPSPPLPLLYSTIETLPDRLPCSWGSYRTPLQPVPNKQNALRISENLSFPDPGGSSFSSTCVDARARAAILTLGGKGQGNQGPHSGTMRSWVTT